MSIYFSSPKEQKNPFKELLFFVILILIFGGVVLAFYSDFFQINRIIFAHNTNVVLQDTAKIIEPIRKKNNNIFLFDTYRAERLLEGIPKVLSVKILRKLPKTLVIDIKERIPALIWQTGSHTFYVDENGYAFTEIKKGIGYPIIVDRAILPVKIGQRVVNNDFVKFVNRLDVNFTRKTKLKRVAMYILDTTLELIIETDNGIKILFATDRDVDIQLSHLATALKRITGQSISYIDLRIDKWIYYCPKGAECSKS